MEVNAAWFCDSWRELPLVARQAVMRRLPALSSGSQCLDRSRCRNISAFSPFLKTVSASTHQYAGWLPGLSSAAASAGPPVVSQQFQQLLPCGRNSIWSCCLITVWGWFKNTYWSNVFGQPISHQKNHCHRFQQRRVIWKNASVLLRNLHDTLYVVMLLTIWHWTLFVSCQSLFVVLCVDSLFHFHKLHLCDSESLWQHLCL